MRNNNNTNESGTMKVSEIVFDSDYVQVLYNRDFGDFEVWSNNGTPDWNNVGCFDKYRDAYRCANSDNDDQLSWMSI